MANVTSKQHEDISRRIYHLVEHVDYKNVYLLEWINIYFVHVHRVVHL